MSITLTPQLNHEQLLAILSNGKDAIALLDEKFRTIYRSPSAGEMTGWSSEDREQNPGMDQTHPEDKEALHDVMNEVLKNPGLPYSIIFRTRHKAGHYIWLQATMTNMLTKENVNAIISRFENISNRKQTEDSLQESIKEISDYKYALDQSSIVAITDQQGIINYVNDNFCKISKYSRDELIGQDHRIINSGYHSKEFIKEIWKTIANGKVWKGEIKNKAKDETFYWVDTTIIPFLDSNNKPFQYMAIRADITERKNAESVIITLNENLERKIQTRTHELEAANKEMESFSYSVAHDLRSPVRAMHGYSMMLEEDYGQLLDEEGKRLLKEVGYNAKKMGALIDDLLTFSRLGRKEISKSRINMNHLADSILEDLKSKQEPIPDIQISELHDLTADSALMRHVLTNLLSNAIKYSSKKETPKVQILSKKEDQQITYSISDNGVGFDMTYADKLFGVFQRLHSDEEFEGTGVGLAIVQRIIQRHGGKIWAKGEEGKGATFYFSLPLK
jgi:PAS domain S-box-containing protein